MVESYWELGAVEDEDDVMNKMITVRVDRTPQHP